MAEQRWEYCQLVILTSNAKREGFMGPPDYEYCSYDAYVRYIFPDGSQKRIPLANPKEYMTFNPFYKAFGQLGASGWELVSIQHSSEWTDGPDQKAIGEPVRSWLRGDNAFAYFKRLSMPGRPVDQPKLNI